MFTRKLMVALLLILIAGTASARHPLEPLDTSSPRATIESFLELTEEVPRLYNQYRNSPTRANQDLLTQITLKSRSLFDLSQVPPAARIETAGQTFLLLWEVIARLELPELTEIPDASFYAEEEGKTKQPARWRIPGTEVTIARVEEGAYAGEFLFSPDTVERVQDFFELARELPYQRPMPLKNPYRIAQVSTGWMIPLVWIEALPDWADILVFGQVLWKWIVVLLLLGLVFAILAVIFRWAQSGTWNGSLRTYLRYLTTPLAILILMTLLNYLIQYQINTTGEGGEVFYYVVEISLGIAAVWLVWLSARWIADAVIASPRINPESLDAHLIRLAARAVGIVAAGVLILQVAHNVGMPGYGLVAGAGVGGIAVALAAKNTLENFMGTLNILADRPIRVGDLCRYDEDHAQGWRPVGRVESIGLRSTKIRRLDRSLTTIPNAEFSQRHIVNLSVCERMLMSTTLGLRYETTDDQLRFVLAELRELLHAHPKTIHTTEDPVRVRFVEFGDYSLKIALRVYIRATEYNEFLAAQEDILLRVMKVVKQAGASIAFPSRVVYHSRDSGLNEEQQQTAEKQVREWISAQILPFPDFNEDYRKQITDTLDFPPDGSPGADRG